MPPVAAPAGDRRALRAARRARVLVATARAIPDLIGTGVRLDALVGSGVDEGERYRPGLLEPAPALVVRTFGARGGVYRVGGRRPVRFDPASVPGEVRDAYGCGDSFAAGLAFGLGAGMPAKILMRQRSVLSRTALATSAPTGAISAQ